MTNLNNELTTFEFNTEPQIRVAYIAARVPAKVNIERNKVIEKAIEELRDFRI